MLGCLAALLAVAPQTAARPFGEQAVPARTVAARTVADRALPAPLTARAGGGRPNIVLITTDDMAVSDLRWMPRTRKLLARQGVTFRNALSPHPLCCPARGGILTGQYAQNNGVKANQGQLAYPALRTRTTLPVWLQRAGYRTGFTGKYLNGFGTRGRPQPGWSWFDPSILGQYSYEGYTMWRNGRPQRYGGLNNVDYINSTVEDLVRSWAPGNRPFFIWASHVAPHGRIDAQRGIAGTSIPLPPRRFRSKFRGLRSPSRKHPAFNEADVSDKSRWLRRKRSRPLPASRVDHIFRARIRSLQGVDAGVAKLVKELRRAGELDNTYIFFTSDNGFQMGEHRLVTKNVPYQESLRVPLLVRGPGVPRGHGRDQLALTIDLAPTFAAIAGARPRVKVDGASLLPTMRQGRALRDTVLIQAGPQERADRRFGWWWRGVTTERYTYAYYFAEGFEELYDRKYDPGETRNLARHPFYSRVTSELRGRTAALRGCSGYRSCSRGWRAVPGPLLPGLAGRGAATSP